MHEWAPVNNQKDFLNSGKRDRVEIIAAIVALTQKASTITNIMNEMSLSYQLTRKYIELMIKKRFIKKTATGKRTIYERTEKGCNFFNIYCEMLRLLYGKDFLKNKNNLAVACLSQCQKAE